MPKAQPRAARARRAADPPARKSVVPPSRQTREFTQQRAHDTHAALMSAAREVFAELGFDAAQTPDIARRAGVSVGTFYRYFHDKRQAFVELITQHLEAAHEDIFARLQPERFAASVPVGDRRAAVDAVLEVIFSFLQRFPGLERVYLEMSLRDPEVERLRVEFEEKGRHALAQLIEVLVPRSRVPDPRAAAQVIQVAVLEVAIGALGVRGPHHPGAPLEAVREALAQMLDRYLFA